MAAKRGLGRGFDSLIPTELLDESFDPTATQDGQVSDLRNIMLSEIEADPDQPRRRFDEIALGDLAQSIKLHGVLQPIVVTAKGGKYMIVAGERRWRAAQMAGLTDVPTLIREIPDESALAMALIENIQRENLNPLEEAQGLQRLVDEFSMTHQEAADAVGRSRPAASNLLRLLQLVPPVQEMLMRSEIDMGHARALLPLSAVQQIQVAQRVAQKGLSVRDTERAVQQALKQPKEAVASRPDRDVLRLQEELSDLLGANVEIRANQKGAGKIQISFGDLDQLEGILHRLR